MTVMIKRWSAFLVGVIAVGCSYLIIPRGHFVTTLDSPVPPDSPTRLILPWYLYIPFTYFYELLQFLLTFGPPHLRVAELSTRYMQSEILYALVYNGILDALVVEDGGKGGEGRECHDLANFLHLRPHAVCEYLQAGYRLGLVSRSRRQDGLHLYRLNSMGALVTSSSQSDDHHGGSMKDFVLMMTDQLPAAHRASATQTIRNGVSGWKNAYGKELFDYGVQHPEQQAMFDRAMTAFAYHETGAVVLDLKLDESPQGLFCDVGGGVGTSLAIILEHHRDWRGIVVDQPSVVERAKSYLHDRGLSERATVLGANFFLPLPEELRECSIFYLKHIIHDWDDESAVLILRNIHRVVESAKIKHHGSKLVLAEHVMDTAGPFVEFAKTLTSVNMLASAVFGAKERTLEEYQELLSQAGYRKPAKLVQLRDLLSLIVVDIL